ncbi:MAG: Asp-tRNA(Asn)/Glu-tRNA(Gln) amidotransferase subunit GatC [Bdellovibrionales bacterium]
MDKDTVLKVGRLARIETDDAQAEALMPKLTNIIGWIEQLSEVDTDDVEPMASPTVTELPLRDDVINDGDCVEKVLANAPDEAQGFFSVPKVIE